MIIPYEKIRDGIILCQSNVDRYGADATILEDAGSYGHAQAFSILAMEEYAKKLCLYDYVLSQVKDSKELKAVFRDHKFKLERIALEFSKLLPVRLEGDKLITGLKEAARILQQDKEHALYVDHKSEAGWINPNKLELKGLSLQNLKVLANIHRITEPLLKNIRLEEYFK